MKIVVIEPLAVEEKRFLEIARAAVGQEHEIVCYDTRTTDVKELGERGKDADIIALGNLPFPREVLEQCENLKMLAVAFTGLDHVDLAYCEERGIKVQNCAGYATTAVAELTFGLMLDLINTARGPVADTKALGDALQSGKIAGAGIDVFDAEPPLDPADPLLHTPHTVVTPHVAFATKESMIKRAIIEFDNIAAFIGERK